MLKSVLSAALAAIVTILVLHSSPAFGKFRLASVAQCAGGGLFGGKLTAGADLMDGVRGSTAQAVGMTCAIADDDRFPKSAVKRIFVHGYVGSSGLGVGATACVLYWGVEGGFCGTGVQAATGGGNFTLTPGLEAWSSDYSSDFGFLALINIGPDDYFDGWYVDDVQ